MEVLKKNERKREGMDQTTSGPQIAPTVYSKWVDWSYRLIPCAAEPWMEKTIERLRNSNADLEASYPSPKCPSQACISYPGLHCAKGPEDFRAMLSNPSTLFDDHAIWTMARPLLKAECTQTSTGEFYATEGPP
ncbi:unnamed protein product [Boreogadus saida]